MVSVKVKPYLLNGYLEYKLELDLYVMSLSKSYDQYEQCLHSFILY